MSSGLRAAAAAALAIAALTLPGAAGAKTVTYWGTMAPQGRIALDVKVGKKNKPKKVVELRADQMKASCEISQAEVEIWTRIRRLGVKVDHGGFNVTILNPEFGNKSKLTGKFKKKNKRIKGAFTHSDHFPAGGGMPEEDCKTEPLRFAAKRGAGDVVVPPPGADAGRR